MSGFDLDLSGDREVEQAEQRVLRVGLDDVEVADGAGEGDVEGVDVELVDFERFIALVSGAAVVEFLDGEVGLVDAVDDFAEFGAVVGDEAVEHDVLVLQPLGFVDREEQRRGEMLARFGLVLVAHDEHGELRRLADLLVERLLDRVHVLHEIDGARFAADGAHQEVAFAVDRAETALFDLEQLVGDARGLQPVAEVGGEHAQFLPLGQRRVFPEELFDLRPGEEVGMDDLVGVAAEQEVAGLFQRAQHERELHRRDVLDFVDEHEVVARLGARQPVLGDQIEVVQFRFGEPGAVFLEQVIERVAPFGRED